jgi:ABC-type molybdenum transport system ATPase subunit/photorepair protein PhrA
MRKAEIDRKSRESRGFHEIVAFAETEKFIDTPVKRYSSGMYVRLAFAVAAHLDPEILLVDEVLSVGDAGFQKKCLGKMGEVARSDRPRRLCAASPRDQETGSPECGRIAPSVIAPSPGENSCHNHCCPCLLLSSRSLPSSGT